MLYEFVQIHRDEIIQRCRAKVATRSVPPPTSAEIDHGVPLLAARGSERLGFLAHELRNLTNTALLAFEALKTGSVGVAGNTGAVLQRSLLATRGLIERSLGEVRLTQGVQNREPLQMSEFIEELAHAATLEAGARGITLTVTSVVDGVVVEADRQVLAAVIGNLLQNALKFTRPRTTVTLRVAASTERVFIEVEDQCGGLPPGKIEELFSPFQQRSTDRTGLGLGLASADGALTPITVSSMRAICLGRDVSSRSICRGTQSPQWRKSSLAG